MSEQREILFQKSMTIDKRNGDFAYLRRNVYPAKTKGLYPSSDFFQERPDTAIVSAADNIVDVLGSEEGSYDIKVIVETAAGNTNFYNLGSNATSNTALSGITPDCAVFGVDGVYMAANNSQIYKIQHVNSNTTPVGTPLTSRANLGAYDGLYYWWISSSKIFKQLPNGNPVEAFSGLTMAVQFVDFHDDKMILVGTQGGSIVVLFWDKSNTTLFEKRIVIQNANLLAMGVVNGTLLLVKAVGNSSNPHEQKGEIVVTKYDGEKFEKINSIKAGDRNLDFVRNTCVSVGSDVMLFGVDNNDDTANPELYNNYVYKVQADGSIEVQTLTNEAVDGIPQVIRLFYNFTLLALNGGSDPISKILINENFSTLFSDYSEYNETVYITNFLNNAYNRHKLDGVGIVFEKLFQQTTATPTGEKLNVYYRTSERDDFVLLGEVTAEKVYQDVDARYNPTDKLNDYTDDSLPLHHQIYHITKMPDMSALPEFNEIQFKFESIRGFSVIQAWYYYTYLTRNTLN
jgi:hypothetical protein